MSRRDGLIAALILVLVFSIAAWSRLRHVDREGYDQPQRWTPEEHPALQQESNFSKSQGNPAVVGWVKRSGPTKIAAIGGSVAVLLDPPYEIAPGY